MVRVCSRCVMDDGCDPAIVFNADGICNHCLAYQNNEKKRLLEKTNLPWVIYKIKKAGRGKKYDVLIGLSGGVDSSMALHYALDQGLRPLCYQIDNGWNTQTADENVMNMVESLQVPFFRYTIDIKRFREAQLAFIKGGIKNLEVLTDHILFASTYEMAAKYGIRHVITGGNLATESIMPPSFGEDARDLYWIKSVYKTVTGKVLKGLPMLPLWKEQWYRLIRRIRFFAILDYYEYDRGAAKKLLAEKYGWQDYGEKHEESFFTKWYQNYYLIEKWGLDKRRPHFSSLINSGQMKRDDALRILRYRPEIKIKGDQPETERHPIDFSDWQYYAREAPKKTYDDYPNSRYIRQVVMWLYRIAKRR